MIYTFSKILEHINIKEIENPIIGKINSNKSESELEKSIGDLFVNKDKKVIIIRFIII